jgi:uncharacterized membrane protein YcaP (DUF421 family)
MDAVIRASVMYGLVFVLMRASGKRTFAQLTAFDFVLLLILAETTQQALVGNDYSITNAALVITTLLGIDIAFSLVKQRWPRVGDLLDGTPLLMIHNGEMQRASMKRARVSESDILEAGRKLHGLERMDQIKHAVLEQSGSISIIPK